MEWFCVIQGERRGPMAFEALGALTRAGSLGLDDLIWEASFGDAWRRVADVPELTALLKAPPLPQQPAAAAVASVEQPEPPPPLRPLTPLSGVEGAAVSSLQAATLAWARMRRLLFAPFDLARWISLGFCAWLATVGSGGCNSQFDRRLLDKQFSGGQVEAVDPLNTLREQIQGFLAAHPALTAGIVIGALVGLLVALALSVAFCWLRARGTFMLLHRLHSPDATIREAWTVAGRTAASLFRWRLTLGILFFLVLAGLLAGALGSLGFNMIREGSWDRIGSAVTPLWIAVWFGLLLVLIAVWSTVAMLQHDFVEPLMYWRQAGAGAAWHTVIDLCRQQPLARLSLLREVSSYFRRMARGNANVLRVW